MAQLEDFTAARLEHYRSRQEAAKGFEDDLEFCPSLSVEELAEIRRKASQRMLKPNVTPPQLKRPIPIIDPTNKTPLNITSVKSSGNHNSSSNSNAGSVAMSSFFSPGSPFSYTSFSPTLAYQAVTLTPTKVTKSIPIVDPTSGNIVNMSMGGPSNSGGSNGSTAGFGGFYSDISVR